MLRGQRELGDVKPAAQIHNLRGIERAGDVHHRQLLLQDGLQRFVPEAPFPLRINPPIHQQHGAGHLQEELLLPQLRKIL